MEDFCIEALTLEQVKALYHERLREDFGPDELKPLSSITHALARGEYACCGAVQGEEILAYAFFVVLNRPARWALVDYYAVRQDLRDKGWGSRFIRALIEGPLQVMDCVLLETEDPDAVDDPDQLETRKRRMRFYLSNGLTDTGVTARVFGVDYRILALPMGPPPSRELTRRVYAALYRAMLPEAVFDKMVRIQ